MPQRVELSAEELALLLGADRFDQPAEREEPADREDKPSRAPSSDPPTPTVTALPSQELVDAAFALAAPLPHSAAQAAPTGEAIQPPTGTARHLGDSDLIQAILDGAANFDALLIRVVRERSAEPLARIVDGAVADAMVAAGTASVIDGPRALVAPLPADVRAAWATWLARWLRLSSLFAMHAPRGSWDDPTGLPMWTRVRSHAAHRIATARMRREAVHVAVLRIEDTDLWNRRAQLLINDAFHARVAAEMDQHVAPGDELSRLEDGAFVLVTTRDDAAPRLADALRALIAQLPGDGPRSLVVYTGMATAPWDATCPQTLLESAVRRAADQRK
jgi:GGDEF domain-containing protein